MAIQLMEEGIDRLATHGVDASALGRVARSRVLDGASL
jgi:hypothetical protein